eukprot:1005157-Pleurochrysis_carterae.AAC.1
MPASRRLQAPQLPTLTDGLAGESVAPGHSSAIRALFLRTIQARARGHRASSRFSAHRSLCGPAHCFSLWLALSPPDLVFRAELC